MQGNWLYILCRVMVFLHKFSLCFPKTIWFLHPKLQRFSSVSPMIGSIVPEKNDVSMSKYYWVRIHRIRNWEKFGPRAHQELQSYLHIEYQKQYLECLVGNTSSSSAKLCQNKEEPFHLPTRDFEGKKGGGFPGGGNILCIRCFFCTQLFKLKTNVFYVSGPGYVRN